MLLLTAVKTYRKLYITLLKVHSTHWNTKCSENLPFIKLTLCEAHAKLLKLSYLILKNNPMPQMT